MDNEFSQVSIQVPEIPDNFDAMSGSNKRDFANAIMRLVEQCRLRGINVEQPQNFDLAEIQNKLNDVTSKLDAATLKQRTVPLDGVNNATIIVPFQDIGTTNYWVNVVFIVPDANIATVTWGLVIGSKQTNQCKIRIDGAGAPYKIEVQIMEAKG